MDLSSQGKTVFITPDEQLERLQSVLQCLGESSLTLKQSKYFFAPEKVNYLGITISADGVSPSEDLIEAVNNFRRPRYLKEVKQFLNLYERL
ncbi:hypothetical protein B4U80_03189 [Leptotrombidium deliense]|uniref:Uncharacterized protein n=1 Tax=Leptotrombidium deliense TaxID=299467 RepID=A0A443RSE7_9ACAR|nr:hypothetical protein B4U80_03189 [Leptotrombidium deliense]